ncbi:MAG: Tfx family DNA-binding protein [Euryarchaeota archaeon]|nr:Tfx family DNA-binding protein [Euryarchaeota archaeon]
MAAFTEEEVLQTFLTPAQARVLELRAKGYTQAQVAEILGTTRANVSITESRARKNIAKAARTLALFNKIGAPLMLEIGRGEDIFNVPKKVFACATECGIKVKENTLSLIEKIEREARRKLDGRVVREEIRITILKSGDVVID